MTEPDPIVRDLQDTIEREGPELGELIVKSLRQAQAKASAGLNPLLYDALDWPTDLDSYGDYLTGFIRWIPQQSDAPAWKVSAPGHRYAKEVSDRLGHFFWLVDQEVHEDGTAIAENSEPFKDWLTRFAREWGSFLDTAESFDDQILETFLRDAPEYTVEESLLADGRPNAPSGWVTFNQFFARELNAGLRPISDPTDNRVAIAPADCIFQHGYRIDEASNIPDTTIKHTHHYGNIAQLIEGSRYADTFAGGTFVHYMLPPSAYHRFHVPVAGTVEEAFVVQGKVFMQVDLDEGELKSRDAANTGFEFTQTRGVITIDTAGSPYGDVGVIGVVAVGMSHVASVRLTATPGRAVAKGEEFGYFQFGGSDIIVLFQPGHDLHVDDDPDPRQVGSVIATITGDRTGASS